MLSAVKKSFLTLVFLLGGVGYAQEDPFPIPAKLEDAVTFWVQVYNTYSKNDVILHDADHLNIIYSVVPLSKSDNEAIDRSSWRKVKQEEREYSAILRKLSGLSFPSQLSALDDREMAVYKLWENVNDPLKFSRASYNIRSQQGLKEHFRSSLERSGRYMTEILKILNKYDLPSELCYLPHVESSFNYKAYSKMGAAGIWQFTRHTGRHFMTINYAIDERWDPITASDAAARLLKKNYEELGTWPMAITAYNHGLDGMKRAKSRLGTFDFGEIVEKYQSRSFGFASKNFYAEFLAAKHVAENYAQYFGRIDFEEPLKYQEFELPDYVTLDALVRLFKVDRQQLIQLNPALRHPIINSSRRIPKGFKLKLPLLEGLDISALYASIPVTEKHTNQIKDQYYRVRRGDNLAAIARRFDTSVEVLMTLNDIRNPHWIHEGQILEMPGNGGRKTRDTENDQATEILAAVKNEIEHIASPNSANAANRSNVIYGPVQEPSKVPAGDLHDPALDVVMNHTMIGPQVPDGFFEKSLFPSPNAIDETGWTFEVNFHEPTTSYIVVQPEETLGHIAEWLGVSASYLRNLNGLYHGRQIQIGQTLHVSFHHVSRSEFHLKRLEYHKSVQEDFFNNFRILLVKTYSIKNGDNIWNLANSEFALPFWLLQRYNKDKNLLRLAPGDEINFPVVVPRNKLPLQIDYVG